MSDRGRSQPFRYWNASGNKKAAGTIMRVDLTSDWRQYASELAGFTMLGVVRFDDGDVGALAQTPLGVYVQLNGALIRDLDQELVKVELAIARRQERQARES